MNLRCKPGDLAMIVYSLARNEGKIVEVLEFIGTYTYRIGITCHDTWACRVPQAITSVEGIVTPAGGTVAISDSALRPIRDPGPDAVDETLRDLEIQA
jgi:hypothetical protein